jgi:hypothetical protein
VVRSTGCVAIAASEIARPATHQWLASVQPVTMLELNIQARRRGREGIIQCDPEGTKAGADFQRLPLQCKLLQTMQPTARPATNAPGNQAESEQADFKIPLTQRPLHLGFEPTDTVHDSCAESHGLRPYRSDAPNWDTASKSLDVVVCGACSVAGRYARQSGHRVPAAPISCATSMHACVHPKRPVDRAVSGR